MKSQMHAPHAHRMFRRLATLLPACSLLALGLGAGAASAQDAPKAERPLMRIGTVAPANTPWSDLLRRFKKEMKGELKVKVHLGGSKGDEQSLVRQVHKGSIQAAGVSTAAMATLVPEFDILELPYLFDSSADADRVLDGPARPIVEKLLEEKGFKLLMYSENGYRSFGTKGGFIKSPADLNAKKMRSQESPVHVETYRALGAQPVPISVGEVLSSLQTGVVIGFDNTPLFTQAASWHQAIDHFTLTRHIYQPAVVVANLEWYNGLSEEIRAALTAKSTKLQDNGRKAVRAIEPLLIQNFEKEGIKVYTPTAAETEVFRKATRPVWEKRRASAGTGTLGEELYNALVAAQKGK